MEQNYFVYKLFNPDYPEFYIGSTKDLKRRKAGHKHFCNTENSRYHNYKVYQYIREHGGYNSWSYEILEHIRNSINVYELRNVERKYIEELKPSLNCEIPNRTIEEYLKQYRKDNKESLNQKKKEKFNCVCGGKYTRTNKIQHEKSKKHKNYIN